MSKLQELIRELCPDGVEYKRLEEVSEFRAGWGFPESEQGKTNGKYPFYKVSDMNSSDVFMDVANNYISEETSIKLRCKPAPKGTIIFPKIGATMGTNKKRILTKDSCYDNNVMGLITKSSVINDMFLYYYFSRFKLMDFAKGTGAVPSLDTNKLKKFLIPVPPLEVQKEIVRILDHFTSLAAELQAELQARKEQYEYYRNKLLTFDKDDKNVKWVKLKEYAEIGTGSSNTQDELSIGLYPFFVRSQIVRRNNEYEFDETAIITSGDGVGVGKIFHYVEGKYALHQRAYRIHVLNEKIIPKFLFHYMRCEFYNYITKNAYTSSVTSIRKPMLLNFPIPILSMSEQQRIVSILDKFEALVNDLTAGIPAEIASVQEQYEYYRNKLLTFKDVGTYHGASST